MYFLLNTLNQISFNLRFVILNFLYTALILSINFFNPTYKIHIIFIIYNNYSSIDFKN